MVPAYSGNPCPVSESAIGQLTLPFVRDAFLFVTNLLAPSRPLPVFGVYTLRPYLDHHSCR